jgi:hypothetical protein
LEHVYYDPIFLPAIIENIFRSHWKKGLKEFEFNRSEIKTWAAKLGIDVPDNVGDLIRPNGRRLDGERYHRDWDGELVRREEMG